MAPKLNIITYGCQMNEYESDRVAVMMAEKNGFESTPDLNEADVVVFNTCSIREKAHQKVYSALGEIRELKKQKSHLVVAVGGCMAQVESDVLRKRFPFVDIFFGTHQWHQLPELVQSARSDRKRHVETDLFGWQHYSFLPQVNTASGRTCEMVTVQNGCDKFCTFCVVPYTRGRQVSRNMEDIVSEARQLIDGGAKEITLLGQNVNAYGNDRSSSSGFAGLLRAVATIDGVKRVRFMTSHPAELTADAIDAMADEEAICQHLHLPVQCGSNRILKKMNRNYTVEHFEALVDTIRSKIPAITLTTDFIVGFPGESDQDFQDTLSLLQRTQFADSFSFCYSPRPHTKASQWKSEFVPLDQAKQRLAQLQTMQRDIGSQIRQSMIGREVEVLVEGPSKRNPNEISGRSRENIWVNFPGSIDLVGEVVPVRIDQVSSNTLKGKICTSS